jgi:hypothetical protein
MENFLDILTKPDNIPIAGMLVAVLFCLWVCFKQALKNDKLIKDGNTDRLYEEMIE